MDQIDLTVADQELSAINSSVGKAKLVKTRKILKKIKKEVLCVESSLMMINDIKLEAFDSISGIDNENKESLVVLEQIVEFCDEMSLILSKIKRVI